MRELQPWGDESSVAGAFDDIAALAKPAASRLRARRRAGLRGARGGRGRAARRGPARELSASGARGGVRGAETRQGRRRGAQAALEADASGAEGDVPRARSRMIADNIAAHADRDHLLPLLVLCRRGRLERHFGLRPQRRRRVPRPARDDQGSDRHRGSSRLGAASAPIASTSSSPPATSTTTVSSASSRDSGRSSASTAIRRSPRRGARERFPTIRAASRTSAAWWRSRSPSRTRGRRRSTSR